MIKRTFVIFLVALFCNCPFRSEEFEGDKVKMLNWWFAMWSKAKTLAIRTGISNQGNSLSLYVSHALDQFWVVFDSALHHEVQKLLALTREALSNECRSKELL